MSCFRNRLNLIIIVGAFISLPDLPLALAEEIGPIPTLSGWDVLINDQFDLSRKFRVYRKYAVYHESIPNLIMFFCSKQPSKLVSHLTFVLPQDFKPDSFSRNSWKPALTIRVLADAASYAVTAEYREGEIYVDDNDQNKEAFQAMMIADNLSLGFGEKNDVIRFRLTEKVEGFLNELKAARSVNMPSVSHHARSDALQDCREHSTL